MTTQEFLHAIASVKLKNPERAVALLWFIGQENHQASASAAWVCRELHDAGFGQQNVTRMGQALARDKRTAKSPGGEYRIRADSRHSLSDAYSQFLDYRPIPRSNSVLPAEMFDGTRGYIEKVVAQLNASFQANLFDCCAVMCRRLLETLIIEVYESKGWSDDVKNSDGRFMMFSGLLAKIEAERRFNIGRNTLEGLKAFKRLGDQSAHDRRFNARHDDIARVRDGIRVACDDLLHLAGLAT